MQHVLTLAGLFRFFSESVQLIFFIGGWVFFVKQLFRNYEIRHVFVQLIFSSTLALSLTMFELIIFEIIGFLDSSSRYFHWRLGLTLLLIMVIAVIPYLIAYSCISNVRIGMERCNFYSCTFAQHSFFPVFQYRPNGCNH